MKIAEADILLIPGLGKSNPGHWQRRWQQRMRTTQWVEQDNWDTPQRDEWVSTISQAVMMATRPVVLVGHALGVAAIIHAAQELPDTKVRGAFLAAPPDIDENPDVPALYAPFKAIARAPLPFPSLMVASTDNPHCTIERASDFANCWGSDFHAAGEAGQINTASGHGPWPEGLMMFTRLMQRLKA